MIHLFIDHRTKCLCSRLKINVLLFSKYRPTLKSIIKFGFHNFFNANRGTNAYWAAQDLTLSSASSDSSPLRRLRRIPTGLEGPGKQTELIPAPITHERLLSREVSREKPRKGFKSLRQTSSVDLYSATAAVNHQPQRKMTRRG